jgi:exodeoxyribonuclease V
MTGTTTTLLRSTLNEGQSAAHDVLLDYAMGRNKTQREWLLKGYAGTGKTHTVAALVESIHKEGEGGWTSKAIVLSAPTHKAVSVLKKSGRVRDVDYSTIHSLLSMKEHINPVTGKQEFKQDIIPGRTPPIEDYDILILDETSMLANELYLLIEPYVISGQLKLIMMGDPVQIPPVNETDPMPFIAKEQQDRKIGVLELTQIVRQAAGNPILLYAQSIRDVYKTGDPRPLREWHSTGETGIELLKLSDGAEISEKMEHYFKSTEFAMNPDYCKVIAWTNAVVDMYNKGIRNALYGADAAAVMKGEKLIADSLIKDPFTETTLLYTNQEMEVLDYVLAEKQVMFFGPTTQFGQHPMDAKINETFKYYDTKVEYEVLNVVGELVKKQCRIHILHEDDREKFTRLLEQHKQATLKADGRTKGQMWQRFYRVQEVFAKVKYNYAITAHKSQGSTYDNVFMLEFDIDKNANPKKREERNRIKYVAATRSRHKLFIIQS